MNGLRIALLGCGLLGSFVAGCSLFDLPGDCGGKVELTGTIDVGGSVLDFDSATTSIDYSEAEGCVFDTAFILNKGGDLSGCNLTLSTTPLVDEQGRLLINSVQLSVNDGNCPTWGLETDLLYSDGDGPFGTVELAGELERDSGFACYVGDIVVELGEVVFDVGIEGETVTLGPATLLFDVDDSAYGEAASCPTLDPGGDGDGDGDGDSSSDSSSSSDDTAGCAVDEWECLDGLSCIPLSWICDGYQDCDDNSDEFEC